METQVLKQNDLSILRTIDRLLSVGTNTVLGKRDLGTQQLLQLGNNRLETIFRVGLAVWSTEVAHEDDCFGAILACVLDCGEGADDTLVVGDFLIRVEWDIEIDL